MKTSTLCCASCINTAQNLAFDAINLQHKDEGELRFLFAEIIVIFKKREENEMRTKEFCVNIRIGKKGKFMSGLT